MFEVSSSLSTTSLTTPKPRDDTRSGGDTCPSVSNHSEGVTGVTKVNSEAPRQHISSSTSSTLTSDDASLVTNTIRCVQSNLRRSHQAQVNLFLDVLNKNVFKYGTNVIFITEPHTVTKSNSLLDVPTTSSTSSPRRTGGLQS